ncbi:RNA-binding protein [Porphyromonas crevioricanis]|uniref:Polyadenylate binding protein, human types 1, 2, 3, 4 family n=2 Tax=Porphyromonas crevioricanis TaxID=393921 RepID=A0A0A2G4J1_9PORP|nr:RNA-binding protein [Porphyromonas crevioricanis]KGN90300.1 RNA-binding protein [Porphyromonas crevioricanis]KGN95359.1 RNA-binding protein [Porphyromonas crevioricanis]SKA03932.1 RNA recognition motif. (a.k.a. RRM, RBD, or RNP domain) [Porphyromonas crevioricanis]SQH72737.1 polyadenylate binding protein, human types 1, 2, 3, 4 family [Porphyromonas crevioricanis]GAD04824.1 RNA-binding protein [Porphyromonas crevioricanis JCM 15906]
MNIYLGNLNYKVRENDLIGLLEQFGSVVGARVILDRETRRSRGFGFVEMENEDEARTAIEQLQEQEFMGRVLVVKEANDRPERQPRM